MKSQCKRSALFLFFTFLVFIGFVSGQNSVVSNPSPCGLNIPITDNNCPEDGVSFNPDSILITVSGAPGTQLGVDVFLKEVRILIQHEWAGDLDISLTAPNGRTAELTSDNGGGDDNYGDPSDISCGTYASFTISSCVSVEEADAPFTAESYQPEEDFYLFNDSLTNPNGQWILQICDDVAADIGTLEFVHLIFESATCFPVREVNLLEIDSTTVIFDWKPSNYCGNTIVEYGPPGFTPGTAGTANQGTIVLGGCPPFVLTGLNEDTEYDIYVRKDCQGGNFSDNSCPIGVRTGCQPPSITIIETFENEMECSTFCANPCEMTGIWRNSLIDDDFDWIVNSGSTATPGTGPSKDVNGDGNYVYIEATGGTCANGSKAFLQSSCIELDKMGSDTCHLSFNYHMFGTNIGSLTLEVSSDGGFNWTSIWEKSGNQGNQWHKIYLGLADFGDGTTLQFRFVGTKGNGSKGDIALDHIVFYGSANLGFPDTKFFVDGDDDGFGTPDAFVLSCAATAPDGFVPNDLDCDDVNPMINPGMPEIPCDGIDNNCNDAIVNDDLFLPSPAVDNDTICSGETAIVCATPNFDKFIIWYGSPDGDDIVGFDECFTPILPLNNSPVPIAYKFYAAETDFICTSQFRTEAIVIVNPQPDINTQDAPQICPGQEFDLSSITIEDANFTGGVTTFHLGLPTSAANQLSNTEVSPMTTTNYFFKVTSPDGCFDEGGITVFVKPGPDLSFQPADSFSICKEATGTIEVQATGGAGDYTYFWSDGSSNTQIDIDPNFVVGALDIYGVTVTDADGCFTTDSVLVTTTNSIDSIRRDVQNVSTCMGNDGSITIVPLNGLPPFNYVWTGTSGINGTATGIADTMIIDNLSQGSYRVTITDSSDGQCDFILRNVLVNGPSARVVDQEVTGVSCAGASDGSICLDVRGDNPQILWNNGATTACIEDIAGGLYAVTITDGPCQTILEDILVEEPLPIIVKTSLDEPSCKDGDDGAISLAVFGGTKPYSYDWNNGEDTPFINNLTAGTYQVTVTDANNCTWLDTLQLGEPDQLELRVDSLRNISCNGLEDGYIRVSGTGGTPPYQYNWATGSTSPVLPNLSPGTYGVTITDFNGCQTNQSLAITEPDVLAISLGTVLQPLCLGDETGEIMVEASGGSAPYTFVWNTGTINNTINNLGVGIYSVIALDANNCRTDTLEIDLRPSSPLDLQIDITAPPCVGPETGQIVLTPNGTAPFRYEWERSTNDTNAVLSNVGVGEYPVRIFDGQGCIYDTVAIVEANQVFELSIDAFQPSCNGSIDGAIDINFLQSGSPPFDFMWSNGSNTSDLFGVGDGKYVVTISDVNDCTFTSDSIEITSPGKFNLKIDGVGEITCNGDSTGFIELTFSGGVPPYEFDWVGTGAKTEDIFDLPAGSYRLLMQDANSCPFDSTFQLTEPPKLSANVEVQVSDVCNGDGGNKVQANIFGGVAPYKFEWSTGATDTCLVDVPAGDYELFVQDANSCVEEVSSIKVREIEQSFKLDTFYVTNVTCNGANDGSMTVKVSGGSGDYRYHFRPSPIINTNNDSLTIDNLSSGGNYFVTILDRITGCFLESEALMITEPSPLNIVRDSVDGVNCFGFNNAAIFTTVDGGVPPYEYQWLDSLGMEVGNEEDLINIGLGKYRLIVKDSGGCTDSLTDIRITESTDLIQIVDSLTTITNITCKGSSDGAIELTLSGGSPPFTLEWSNGAESEDIMNLSVGIYTLTVTDSDNCRAIFPGIQVMEPAEVVMATANITPVSCFAAEDGVVDATVSGGMPPYQYSWTYEGFFLEGESSNLLDGIPAGLVSLTVKDTNDCIQTFDYQVPTPLPITIELVSRLPEPPSENGRIEAVVSGGTPEYSYLWSNGSIEKTIEMLGEGIYSVTVTDSENCQADTSEILVPVLEPSVVSNARVQPNPSTGLFYLDIVLRNPQRLDWKVVDVLGRQIQQGYQSNVSKSILPIDLQHIPTGTYFLELYAEGKRVYSEKLLLLR